MKTFSATDAAISGFRLVREHPKAMAVWVVIATLLSATVGVLMVVMFGPQLEAFSSISQDSASADPTEVLKAMAGIGPAFLFSLAYVMVVYAVLLAGIYRVVLRPADTRGAYLRFGADELRQAAVSLLLGLLMTIAYVAAVVVGTIVFSIFLAISQPLAALVGLILVLGAIGGLIFVLTRLSLANVQTFATGKINLFGSWALTKGRFWPMFGAYFVAYVLAGVVYLLLVLIVIMVGAALSGGDLASLGDLLQSRTNSLESLTKPMGLVSLAFGGLTTILLSVTAYTPAAVIYREIEGPGAAPTAQDGQAFSGPFVV